MKVGIKMEENKLQLAHVVELAFEANTLKESDIPQIELYMDQVITLFNEHIGFVENENDKITKAMINNYRKEEIISPMKGKRYSKTQIFQILLIYYLKQAMPIIDIKTVLNKLDDEDADLQFIYNTFLDNFERQKQELTQQFYEISNRIEDDNKTQLTQLLLEISSNVAFLTNLSKNIVEKLF